MSYTTCVMYIEIFIIRLSPLKASATLGIALIVSYVQVRHATIQANGTLANVDQTESMFKFRGGSLIFPKRFVNNPKSSLIDRYWPTKGLIVHNGWPLPRDEPKTEADSHLAELSQAESISVCHQITRACISM